MTYTFNKRASLRGQPPSSQYKGVCRDPASGLWRATISIQGKAYYLGRYKLEVDAARAYNAKAQEVGVHASRLNKID